MLPAGAPAGGVGARGRDRVARARVWGRAFCIRTERACERCSSPGRRAEAVHHVDERLEDEQEALLVVAGHLAGELLGRVQLLLQRIRGLPLLAKGLHQWAPLLDGMGASARAARPCVRSRLGLRCSNLSSIRTSAISTRAPSALEPTLRRERAPVKAGAAAHPEAPTATLAGARRGGRAVECGGLENRYPSLGGSRVQIPPPPLRSYRELGASGEACVAQIGATASPAISALRDLIREASSTSVRLLCEQCAVGRFRSAALQRCRCP